MNVAGLRVLRVLTGLPRRALVTFVVFAASAWCVGFAGATDASAGSILFKGGSVSQQRAVLDALNVSVFPWSRIPYDVVVVVGPGLQTSTIKGIVQIDSNLLDSGEFAWGIVQHEFGHQVDWAFFDTESRATLAAVLGYTPAWCVGDGPLSLAHDLYGCERFASAIAYAFWPSCRNAIQPLEGDLARRIDFNLFRELVAAKVGFSPILRSETVIPTKSTLLSRTTAVPARLPAGTRAANRPSPQAIKKVAAGAQGRGC